LKKEYPQSCQILLDFPEQLVLAHYFHAMNFPDARIAGFREIYEKGKIDRAFLEKYDLVLVPLSLYKNIQKGAVDLVMNFASFGEMKREWFDLYLKNEPFLSAKYFFTENRFQSAPDYDSDITVLDYPLHDFKTLRFGICPIFFHYYAKKNMIFNEKKLLTSQFFEFIGERK